MEYAFSLKHINFRYSKKRPEVLQDVSFDVAPGTIFGLLGPSGAGKSTTQKLMSKLLSDYEGEITYFGKDLKKFNKSFYEDIGVGFEMPVHFNKLTAMENLSFFANLYGRKIDYEALLVRVGLGEAKHQQVGQYSKGMKARLNFVRALLNDPKVIFLDEPTNGLDPTNARIIKDIILEQKAAGKTIFISTHLMGDVEQLCDQVAFIANGKVLEISSPKALKLKYGKPQVRIEYMVGPTANQALFPLENLGTNPSFLDIIKNHTLVTIHSDEMSMEQIFIDVVGQKAKP
ncbi:MAG: ABC transporter ATP-binding protein [Bacilli bacterium]|jgi:fluoroquinolone transport system ATP-binding protein